MSPHNKTSGGGCGGQCQRWFFLSSPLEHQALAILCVLAFSLGLVPQHHKMATMAPVIAFLPNKIKRQVKLRLPVRVLCCWEGG